MLIFGLIGANKKISDKSKRKVLIGIASFQLFFEVFWRIIYLFVKKDNLIACYPMYPCNLGGIIIPIFALTNCKKGKQMFYLFGFVGGCLTFALPEGIFSTSVYVFPIVKSVLQHTGLLIIPLFEFTSKTFKASIKDYWWLILGCVIHVINCEFIDRLLGLEGDYMFFRSGMPFVIPHVSQFITLSIFAVIVLFILSLLTNIEDSKEWFSNLRNRFKIIKK